MADRTPRHPLPDGKRRGHLLRRHRYYSRRWRWLVSPADESVYSACEYLARDDSPWAADDEAPVMAEGSLTTPASASDIAAVMGIVGEPVAIRRSIRTLAALGLVRVGNSIGRRSTITMTVPGDPPADLLAAAVAKTAKQSADRSERRRRAWEADHHDLGKSTPRSPRKAAPDHGDLPPRSPRKADPDHSVLPQIEIPTATATTTGDVVVEAAPEKTPVPCAGVSRPITERHRHLSPTAVAMLEDAGVTDPPADLTGTDDEVADAIRASAGKANPPGFIIESLRKGWKHPAQRIERVQAAAALRREAAKSQAAAARADEELAIHRKRKALEAFVADRGFNAWIALRDRCADELTDRHLASNWKRATFTSEGRQDLVEAAYARGVADGLFAGDGVEVGGADAA